MNKLFHLIFIVGTAIIMFASCVSNKEMTYVQGIDSIYFAPRNIDKDYGLLIQSDDELAISVTSKDKELIAPFNNGTVINGGGNNSNSQANTSTGMAFFYVSKDGTIDFPILGKIKVKGLTINQVSDEIQKQIRNAYISDAIVSTKIMSFKVTVMGDVRRPGVQTLKGQRLTLLEALGNAGDLNNTAVRKNVLIIREENGKRISFRVDLTNSRSVFNSPAYFLQQNDVIYVQSNRAEKVKGSTSYTYLSVVGTFVSVVASVVSLIVALSK